MSVFPTLNNQRVYLQLNEFLKKGDYLKPGYFDVLIIGSGMGSMTCAAALAKLKYKVLVLEQHYLPGGYTHMFSRQGVHWDVGVHAIGDLHPKGRMRRQLDWLTQGHMKFNSLGNPYDQFFYPDQFEFGFSSSIRVFKQQLIEKFPNEKAGIEKYFNFCFKAIRQTLPYFAAKTLPRKTGSMVDFLSRNFTRDWWSVTVDEVMNECNLSFKLRNLLTAQWGYHGTIPARASFGIQALIHGHFSHGAYYPEGGAKEFAAGLLGTVRSAGGECVCQAQVAEVIVEAGKAQGVKLTSGQRIMAKKVVSGTSVKISADRLIKGESKDLSRWRQSLMSVEQSASYLCLNLIFEGDITKYGAGSSNLWFMQTWDMNQQQVWDITQPESVAPILYVSFPSLKDPSQAKSQKHAGECVTFVDWRTFSNWENSQFKRRPEDYEQLKRRLQDSLIQQLGQHLPELMKHCTYAELSTPLSSWHFIHSPQGSIYGLASTPERYNNQDLRAKTPIKNFYLTGVDIVSTGIGGALNSGLLTAATIDKRIFSKLLF